MKMSEHNSLQRLQVHPHLIQAEQCAGSAVKEQRQIILHQDRSLGAARLGDAYTCSKKRDLQAHESLIVALGR
jgi:hypothetical protein